MKQKAVLVNALLIIRRKGPVLATIDLVLSAKSGFAHPQNVVDNRVSVALNLRS